MLAAASTAREVLDLVAQLAGLVVLAGAIAAVAAFVFRWYVREAIPRGLSLLVGLSGVAVYLNTTRALGQVIGGSTLPTETEVALFNVAAFAVATGGAVLGRRAGDRFGTDVVLTTGREGVEANVGRLVQSVGRVIAVELPATIEDTVGYDPVPAETKEKLAGKTFLFPRRLTVEELRDRLVSRLKTDYGVGHVDIELADDGTVEYLALGSRAAGIGPTLPPATNAVAIRADPAFAASAGDLVQVWEAESMERVLTAELRGVADETVTVAIDAADTPKVDPRKEYRLVTLPVEDRPDREFASLLRAAEETVSSVTVEAGSPLHGLPVAALALTVVAVTPESGDPIALPEPSYVLAPGDGVFAIARPDELRRLDRASKPLDPSLVRDAGEPTSPEASPPAGTAATGDDRAGTATDRMPGVTATRGPDDDSADGAVDPGTTDASADTGAEPAADADEPPAGQTAEADVEDGGDADSRAGADVSGGQADGSSFQQLKEEFESGEADWTDDTEDTDDGTSDGDGQRVEAGDGTADESDRDDGLDDLAVGGMEDGGGFDLDDDEVDGLLNDTADTDGSGNELDDPPDGDDDLSLGGDDDRSVGDPLSTEEGDLSFDDGDDDLSFDDENPDLGSEDGGTEDDEPAEEDDGDEDGDGDEDADDAEEDDRDGDADDEDEDDGGGGGKSFQQLKEEFESGEADWEDDVSDSPGGDMRLDE